MLSSSSSIQPNITTAKSRLPIASHESELHDENEQDESKLKAPKLQFPKGNVWIALLLTALSFFTRLYQIEKAAFVVW